MLRKVFVKLSIFLMLGFLLISALLSNIGYICTNQALKSNTVNSLTNCETWFKSASLQGLYFKERSLYGLANLFFLEGKWELALELSNELIEMEPKNDAFLLLRAEIYNELGRSELALKDYEQINLYPNADFVPHQVKNYLKYSDEQLALGNREVAADTLRKAISLDPNNWYALIHLEKIEGFTHAVDSILWNRPSVNSWNNPELLAYDLRALTEAYQLGQITAETWFTTVHFIIWYNSENQILLSIQDACTNLQLNDVHCETLLNELCRRNTQLDTTFCSSYAFPPTLTSPTFDSNLLSDEGDFEIATTSLNKHPERWQWLPFFYRQRWGPGDFRGGTDCSIAYSGNCSLRIHGLWFERAEGVSWPKAGFSTPPLDLSAGCYALSFAYRTSPFVTTSHAGVNLEQFSQGAEITLPETNGRWEIYEVNFQAPKSDNFSPMFRLWGMGTVWYDRVVLQKIPC